SGNRDAVVPGDADLGRTADFFESGANALPDEAGDAALCAAIITSRLHGCGAPDVDSQTEAVESGTEVSGGGGSAYGEFHARSLTEAPASGTHAMAQPLPQPPPRRRRGGFEVLTG